MPSFDPHALFLTRWYRLTFVFRSYYWQHLPLSLLPALPASCWTVTVHKNQSSNSVGCLDCVNGEPTVCAGLFASLQRGSQAAIDVTKCAQAYKFFDVIPSTALIHSTPQQHVEEHSRDQLYACQREIQMLGRSQDCEKECGNSTFCYTTCLAKKGCSNATAFWKRVIDKDCLNIVSTGGV